MFVSSQPILSEYGERQLTSLKVEFLQRWRNQYHPPRSSNDVRFYIVDWNEEGNKGLVNAGLDHLNESDKEHTGGIWLAETFEDMGRRYAIAAAWWVD